MCSQRPVMALSRCNPQSREHGSYRRSCGPIYGSRQWLEATDTVRAGTRVVVVQRFSVAMR
jgi:hypothetical protein